VHPCVEDALGLDPGLVTLVDAVVGGGASKARTCRLSTWPPILRNHRLDDAAAD